MMGSDNGYSCECRSIWVVLRFNRLKADTDYDRLIVKGCAYSE